MNEPYVVLHGGFHKTASSQIQMTLNRNKKLLERHGVTYVHHRDTRKELTVPCQLFGYEELGLNYKTKYTEDELKARTSAFFNKAVKPETERLILSEENMAGHCGHCVRRGVLYTYHKRLVGIFARHIPYKVREVHLSVRNYADFFASAYVEYLRSLDRTELVDPDTLRKLVIANAPNWYRVLEDVAATFPGATITVWPFESFRDVQPRILKNLCGPDFDTARLKTPKSENKRPSASQRAVDELLKIVQETGVPATAEQRVSIQETYPRSAEYPGFDPWTAQERHHLSRIYNLDLKAIAGDPRFVFLGHQEAGAYAQRQTAG